MEFWWSGQKWCLHLFPYRYCCVDDFFENLIDWLGELIWRENWLNNRLEYNPYFVTKNHIHNEEMVFESVGNVIPSSSWLTHGSNKGNVLNVLEVSSFVFLQSVKPSVLYQLSDDFQCNLVSPFILLWHGKIVYEKRHSFSILWTESLSNFGFANWLYCLLKMHWLCCRREVDPVEEHFLLVEFLRVH